MNFSRIVPRFPINDLLDRDRDSGLIEANLLRATNLSSILLASTILRLFFNYFFPELHGQNLCLPGRNLKIKLYERIYFKIIRQSWTARFGTSNG